MPLSVIMRPFEPTVAEYEAIVRVYNQANPLYTGSADTWRHWDQHRDPVRQFTRYVVERHGEIGGYGFSRRTDIEKNIFVLPSFFCQSGRRPSQLICFIVILWRSAWNMPLLACCVKLGRMNSKKATG